VTPRKLPRLLPVAAPAVPPAWCVSSVCHVWRRCRTDTVAAPGVPVCHASTVAPATTDAVTGDLVMTLPGITVVLPGDNDEQRDDNHYVCNVS
jgi:hypothetical protein